MRMVAKKQGLSLDGLAALLLNPGRFSSDPASAAEQPTVGEGRH